MSSGKQSGRVAGSTNIVSAIVSVVLLAGIVWAQTTASIGGALRDSSGAVIPGATITVKNLESGLTRTAVSDSSGSYSLPSLPVGQYEMTADKTGFKQSVRRGITLVVGQQATINFQLEVGNIEQQVTVTEEAPLVDTTPSTTSGLVGEKEVKDLPLNGRSFDQLLTLNVGTANYSSNTNHNAFSVVGRRPEENKFIINGVEYTGGDSSGQTVTPNGASGYLLGVDAVREFNVVQHTYGAEYGKRAGGQVSIVTSSGTNQLHGDMFEFLRNSDLDARNFFDIQKAPSPTSVAPFKRNQFGGSLGGPIRKDKMFLFGNYEGFRYRLGVSGVSIVPDNLARQGILPIGPGSSLIQVPNLRPGMLPIVGAYWPAPNGPELMVNGVASGLAFNYASPIQKIREDFGLTRFDDILSEQDSFSATYLMDDGENDNPSADPIFIAMAPTRNQMISLQETHVFSPTLLNVATVGYGRAFSGSATPPVVPIPPNLWFVSGKSAGAITVGGGIAATVSASVTTPSGNPPLFNVRNAFNYSDDLHYQRGIHSLTAGVWIQRSQQNISGPSLALAGSVSYSTLTTLLQDLPTAFLAVPNTAEMGYRTTEAAWYVQDEIKLRTNLTLRLGLRDEMTTGWNEHTGRASNYLYDQNGVIETNPIVGPSAITQNNAIALWQPRVGLAWDPTGSGKWSVRAGAGIFNTLQDSLAHRLIVNPPFNSQLEIDNTPLLSFAPIPGGTLPPPACQTLAQLATAPKGCTVFQPGGLDPIMHTPTTQEWSLTVERAVTNNLKLQVGYVGSQSYHISTDTDLNMNVPQVCQNPLGCAAGGISLGGPGQPAATLAPQGTLYMPAGQTRPNPFVTNPFSWFYYGNSSYNAMHVSLIQRAAHGLAFKADYSFAKAFDINSAVTASAGTNEPQTTLDPFNLKLNKGLAAFNIHHQFNFNFTYELPFGAGRQFGSGASGIMDKLIGGWQWNGILTAQTGFPFTPVVGSNRSGSGDTRNPDVPNIAPGRSNGNITSGVSAGCSGLPAGTRLGTPNHYYDSCAFSLPIQGTFGNAGRSELTGPGLFTLDTSLFKNFRITERWNLQFRAEGFNLLNHANFYSPSPNLFSGVNYAASAGVITRAQPSRQVQFALKLIF